MIEVSNDIINKLNGLSHEEVKSQLIRYGYNELPMSATKNILDIFVEIMREPMFILLVSSAIIYIFLGDYKEGLILLTATIMIIFIAFFQYRKAENALAALRKLATPQALVLRDGIQQTIPGREVVPNDIVFLNEGDRVVADAILIQDQHIWMDEALLTGESMPVKKIVQMNGEVKTAQSTLLSNATNEVYAGTLVVQGSGVVKIVATGVASKFGKIGIALNVIKEDITKLQLEMKTLIKHLFIIGVSVSIAVVIAFYFTRGGLINAILNGISTSMAVLPEEFPVVLTVFLAIGAWRLSKIQVLTRKPSAIETLGAVTVLCVDKTGTITMNSMEIAFLYDGVQIFDKTQSKENELAIFDLLRIGILASASNRVNPMEKAIANFIVSNPIMNARFAKLDNGDLVHAYPLSNAWPCMTNIYASKDSRSLYAFTKGAPEQIFKLCGLDIAEIELHQTTLASLAQQSLRVIAIASAPYLGKTFPADQSELHLNFAGFIAFEDPIRPEVPAAINECKAAGVKVKIITGDFPLTAKSIAHQIGLAKDGIVITGTELDAMSDLQLAQKMDRISVFARVIPSQKLRIVNALKLENEVVAMTGDGVNDAPALKAAHIGIAMGKRGTEVAREAASLVLLDDNFASIVAAIRQGRKIFDNLQKAMEYILAIHIPIIGLTLLPALDPFVPFILLPLHIICLELVVDPVSSIAFESQVEEKKIMQRPPRNADSRFFGTQKIIASLIKGFSLLCMVLMVLFIGKYNHLSDPAIRTTCYATLVLGNIALVLTSLSKTRSFIDIVKNKNWAAIGIVFFALLLLFIAVEIPSMQSLFKFENPGFQAFLPTLLFVFIFLMALEFKKYLVKAQR